MFLILENIVLRPPFLDCGDHDPLARQLGPGYCGWMNAPHSIRFRLAIAADEYLAYYQRRAQDVIVKAEDGRTVRFPANAVQRFLNHQGVYGLFEMQFDDKRKLINMERIGD